MYQDDEYYDDDFEHIGICEWCDVEIGTCEDAIWHNSKLFECGVCGMCGFNAYGEKDEQHS